MHEYLVNKANFSFDYECFNLEQKVPYHPSSLKNVVNKALIEGYLQN